MRPLFLSAMLFLAASSLARADDLACVSTTFRFTSPSDKVCVSNFDDPKVPGVTCFNSQARKGGWGQPLGLNEDPSNFSVACRQLGPITTELSTLPEKEEAFSEKTSIFFKADAHLPGARRETERDHLSRRQLEGHRGFAGERDQRRADHALGVEVTARERVTPAPACAKPKRLRFGEGRKAGVRDFRAYTALAGYRRPPE